MCVNLGSRTAKLTVLAVEPNAAAGMPAAPLVDSEADLDELDRVVAERLDASRIDVVAYRVVRSVPLPDADAVRFDAAARAAVEAATEFAPLHTPGVLRARDVLGGALPRADHVAVFDGAFHRTIPERAAASGLPYAAFRDGWRKLGYHGLSHGYAAARTAVLLGDGTARRKLVSAHLGGGASLAAIDGERSVDTTMGFTPLDGLMMTTRSGSLDPGMLLAYMRRHELSVDAMEDLLSNRCGLLGLGGSADMREILAKRASGDAAASLAYDVFVYRAAAGLGAMAAALGGLEAIAFLGGIGENAAAVRADVCASFAFAGVRIDAARNADPTGDGVVSADGSIPVVRIHTREDWMMALIACRFAARPAPERASSPFR